MVEISKVKHERVQLDNLEEEKAAIMHIRNSEQYYLKTLDATLGLDQLVNIDDKVLQDDYQTLTASTDTTIDELSKYQH